MDDIASFVIDFNPLNKFGRMHIIRLFRVQSTHCKLEKIRFLLHYFSRVGKKCPADTVSFCRFAPETKVSDPQVADYRLDQARGRAIIATRKSGLWCVHGRRWVQVRHSNVGRSGNRSTAGGFRQEGKGVAFIGPFRRPKPFSCWFLPDGLSVSAIQNMNRQMQQNKHQTVTSQQQGSFTLGRIKFSIIWLQNKMIRFLTTRHLVSRFVAISVQVFGFRKTNKNQKGRLLSSSKLVF